MGEMYLQATPPTSQYSLLPSNEAIDTFLKKEETKTTRTNYWKSLVLYIIISFLISLWAYIRFVANIKIPMKNFNTKIKNVKGSRGVAEILRKHPQTIKFSSFFYDTEE